MAIMGKATFFCSHVLILTFPKKLMTELPYFEHYYDTVL